MVMADARPAQEFPEFREFPAALTSNRSKEEILADVKSMKRPEFIHPYPSRVNRHASKAVANSIAWFHDQKCDTMLSDPEKMQLFLRSRIHDLVTGIYVDAEEEHLSWLCCFMLWIFIVDDVLDESGYFRSLEKAAPIIIEHYMVMMWSFPNNPSFHDTFVELITFMYPEEQQRQAVFDTVETKLAEARLQPGSVYDTSDLGPLISAFNDLWGRFLASAPIDSVIRWGNSIQKYLIGNVMEVKNRTSGHVPSTDEYIFQRRKDAGVEPCMLLAEFADNLSTSLPAELFDSDEMRVFLDAINDVIGWHNDIYSFKKEMLGSEYHNLVSIVSHTRGCSLSDAQAIALDMLHNRVEDLNRAIADLETLSTPDSQEVVAAYIKTAQFWVSGVHDFTLTSERYSWD